MLVPPVAPLPLPPETPLPAFELAPPGPPLPSPVLGSRPALHAANKSQTKAGAVVSRLRRGKAPIHSIYCVDGRRAEAAGDEGEDPAARPTAAREICRLAAAWARSVPVVP